jgi:hypothetical protein
MINSRISKRNIIEGKRHRTETFAAAISNLRYSNHKLFLANPNVRALLTPATDLLGGFGQGHSKRLMTDLWMAMWSLSLVVVEDTPVEGKCCACNLTRALEFNIYVRENGQITHIGVMGRDCYEVKFKVLRKLVRACYKKKLNRIHDLLEEAKMAPITMARRYE